MPEHEIARRGLRRASARRAPCTGRRRPAAPGAPTSPRHPLDDRKALPRSDIDRADGARRQVDRSRRRDADTADVTACGGERLGDQRVDHRPDRLGVAVRRRQLRVVDELARRHRRARRRSSCRRCRWPASGRPSVPVGVVGLTGVAGMLVAGGEPDQLGPPRVEPQPEGAPAGGATQMLDDQRAHGIQRRGDHCRCAPAVSGVRRRSRSAAGCGRGSRPRRRR